ncbi:hypothetical protein U9M48_017972 [Paspalum notatum var. saurae]|uniref:RNase H type-1 domain-containing protein n=1 Tax=Paspalum notatum var. saurae TaxID=547442 RepID=A0AAQ3T9N4_PASNO
MHAMIRCPHARALRDALREDWKLLLLLWRTWQVRNDITHDTKFSSVASSVIFIRKYWSELCMIRHSSNLFDDKGKQPVFDSQKRNQLNDKTKKKGRWILPESGWIKINVDGAFDDNSKEAGIGVIIRDESGQVLLSSCRYVYAGSDAEEIEALACKEGLSLEAEWINKRAILETDCKSVKEALKKPRCLRSKLTFIITEAMEDK